MKLLTSATFALLQASTPVLADEVRSDVALGFYTCNVDTDAITIPVGLILCATSIAHDHWPTRDAAVRGALYGATIVVALVLLALFVPTVPA